MAGRVDGKMSFVTGAAQGLGEAIAYMLAKEGSKVVLADINYDKVVSVSERINNEFPEQAFSLKLDVTSEDQWKESLIKAEKLMGGINVLVNNAGIGGGTTIEDTDYETFQNVMKVDTDSVFLGCKYAIPIMKNYSPGSIVNTSSIAGLIAGHNMASYNTAKAGVWMLSKSVALHCARQAYNIRCNSIHPTFINTPILDNMLNRSNVERDELLMKLARQVPLGKVGEPNDVAYTVLFLASDESKFITGSEIKIDGGISAM
ncbi:MAG: 3-beta hydroxysteroid dehydrogenase [Rhodobiaceae bacterium]|nr:3-beta hydroxysteroid dehydrogenase [Rhodobiaceae bacterium]|tara:strand:+ start:767 stop:1546 length:780 start_codon:yes stop_codon:yes gene_type:complete